MKVILSLFYLGYFRYAPGTLASLVTMLLCYFFIPMEFLVLLFLFTSILGFYFCYFFTKINKQKDPSYIVIDEAAGMLLCLLFLPKNILLYLVAFLLFRFFDILKPSFIFNSQDFNNGVGIMVDDIISGLVVNILLINYYF